MWFGSYGATLEAIGKKEELGFDPLDVEREIALMDFFFASARQFGAPAKLLLWAEYNDENDKVVKGFMTGANNFDVSKLNSYDMSRIMSDDAVYLCKDGQFFDAKWMEMAKKYKEAAGIEQLVLKHFENDVRFAN